jgi:uncharacterized membrane protein
MIVDADTVTTVANQIVGVRVSPNRSATANINTTQLYHHTVRNLGNGSDSFSLNVLSSLGWTAQVHPAAINLAAGASVMVEVRVSVPDGASGQTDVTTLTAASLADGSVTDSAMDETTAVNNANLSLTPDWAATVVAGDSYLYVHTLTNNADITDTVDLAVSSDKGWLDSFRPASVALDPGASVTVYVTVTVPAGSADGTVDMTTVTATSGNQSNVKASASNITIVVVPTPVYMVYLPLVTRNQ